MLSSSSPATRAFVSQRSRSRRSRACSTSEASLRVPVTNVPRPGRADADTPGESLADALGEEEDGFERAEQRATLAPLLAHVSSRERLVLTLRFGEDLTQAEIGERIGVSQMQVSRLIRQALIRLRAGLTEQPPPGEGPAGERPAGEGPPGEGLPGEGPPGGAPSG